MRRFWLGVLVSASAVLAQSEKKPSFEVVAIKPVSPPSIPQNPRDAASQIAFKVDGAQVEIRGFPPLSIIARAFRVPAQRVVAPDFARSQYFEIRATLPEGANPDQVPEMLQSMLVERVNGVSVLEPDADGSRAAVHDALTGSGFARTPRGLRLR